MTVSYPTLGVIWGVIKYVVGIPIVNTALDHWTDGTSNKIDDMVWDWIQRMAGVPDDEKVSTITATVHALQIKYDELKDAGLLAEYKEAHKAWDSTALVRDTFSTSNIG